MISITNTARPATDLGYLLHKNPASLNTVELSFGQAHVFYPAASDERCTACLLVELNPVELVRGGQQMEDYVNDRPYVASSFVSVAVGRVFGTALAGRCQQRPELVPAKLPLKIQVEVVRVRGGAEVLNRLFEPLGYTVSAQPIVLDSEFPEWGYSRYFRLTLEAGVSVHDALSHLYVLLPVLDDNKHYYVGEAEVDKLLRHGEGWLSRHPERRLIVGRYLKRRGALVDQAFARLVDEESGSVEEAESQAEEAARIEKDLERPMTLHTQRLNRVAATLKDLGVRTVVDLGCGEGRLLRRLLADSAFERIAGMDVSHRALETASSRLRLDTLPERRRRRVEIFQGSLLYRDKRLTGFDAAVMVEVIEHLDPPRLSALERAVFEFAHPHHVLITTPNQEYNRLFPTLPPGALRHGDHRFEWTRVEFGDWAQRVAAKFGYELRFESIGPINEHFGAPTQMAIFSLPAGSAA